MKKQSQKKRFKYLENHTFYRDTHPSEVNNKMPKKIKTLTEIYSSLDLNDLKYLEYKHHKNKDKYALKALMFAKSRKTLQTEKYLKQIENNYIPECNISYNILDGEQ